MSTAPTKKTVVKKIPTKKPQELLVDKPPIVEKTKETLIIETPITTPKKTITKKKDVLKQPISKPQGLSKDLPIPKQKTPIQIQTWLEKFPEGTDVKISSFPIHGSWDPMMAHIYKIHGKEINNLELMLNNAKNSTAMFPYPDNVFNAFNKTHLSNIKVVISGQDPYFKAECINKIYYPQAIGLSFAVQELVPKPPSVKNIYENLLKFGHIDEIPAHGNLTKWAEQGVLLLNSSLTVTSGMPNSHQKYWEKITDSIIKYISDNTNNVMFFLWGSPALKKKILIDETKHKTSISSHPSPLSFKNGMGEYKPFFETDHFKVANDYLVGNGMDRIDWTIV